ncbi:MAG: adenylate/guanylate cyclase domain-containing protein [Geminicoccaceae bacterium]
MAQRIERKLTTVLCADVAGYSRLMDQDEVGTLARLKQHRAALAGLIGRHGGRVVNTWGDGLIADFPSVVEAVQCAVEAQQELGARNGGLSAEERLEFRIGINLGDVMVEGEDLYGEGVNIAARLQALAEPGGVMISGTVHDLVRGKLAVRFDALGPQQVKNLAEPVPAFRVTTGPATAGRAMERKAKAPPAGPAGGWTPLQLRAARYAMIGLFLLAVNLIASPHSLWFYWPVLGMTLHLGLLWTREP